MNLREVILGLPTEKLDPCWGKLMSLLLRRVWILLSQVIITDGPFVFHLQ
jgi:hypothetical protein